MLNDQYNPCMHQKGKEYDKVWYPAETKPEWDSVELLWSGISKARQNAVSVIM